MLISFPSSESAVQTWPSIPLGFEAVITPAAPIDLGLRFMVEGWLRRCCGPSDYAEQRTTLLWLRFKH